MKELLSDALTSETRREGLKQISVSIHNLLLLNVNMTYQQLIDNIHSTNTNTLRRRVYDVLSVMKALNMVTKDKKNYRLIARNILCEKRILVDEKKKQLNQLTLMKESFEHITLRNNYRIHKPGNMKFYLPFMIVSIEKNSDVHCETNEERTFFKFRSNRPIKLVEDLEILREIYRHSDKKLKKRENDSLREFKESFCGVFDHIL